MLPEDIERALRDRRYRARPATFCPIARALCRALGLALGSVKVGGNSLSLWGWKDHEYLRVSATKKIERAVTTFDREQQMQPSSFRIKLTPSPVHGG